MVNKRGKITKGMTKRVKEVVKKAGGFPFVIPRCEFRKCPDKKVCFHYCKEHHQQICVEVNFETVSKHTALEQRNIR